ncbi:MAG TPA: M48 family metalloprotease [Candidatus Brocadiia bacterium]|nr:M48 family metalloprotease [Candidatus Brocadiales bacterium]
MRHNKNIFMRAVFIIIFIFFFGGCQTPAPLNRITFVKDFPLSGEITVVPTNNKGGQTARFLIESEKDSYIFDFAEMEATKVLVRLDHYSSTNLPERKYRKAVITTEIRLDKDNQHVKVSLKEGNIILSAGPLKGADCNNLYNVDYHSNALDIQFVGFRGLTSCSGKDYDKANPLLIGSRDIAKSDFLNLPNFFTVQQELFMGKQFTDEYIEQNKEAILPQNHSTSTYLQELTERIVNNSDNPDIQPHVYVINADVLNAFALPGGYVFVFRGLIDAAESESQLVGVLGHEWAHVTARHGTRNMGRAILTTNAALLASSALKSLSDKTIFLKEAEQIVSKMLSQGGTLFLMHKSREAELEADKIGSQYTWAAGFEPWGIAGMFEIFKKKAGGGSTFIEELLNTHPNYDTRIQNVLDLCAFYYPEKGNYIHTSDAFENAKGKLMELPLPDREHSKNIGMGFANAINEFVKNTVLTESFERYFEDSKSGN